VWVGQRADLLLPRPRVARSARPRTGSAGKVARRYQRRDERGARPHALMNGALRPLHHVAGRDVVPLPRCAWEDRLAQRERGSLLRIFRDVCI